MFLNLDRSRRRCAPGSRASILLPLIRRLSPPRSDGRVSRVARPEPGIYPLQVATSRIGFRQWSHPRTPQSNPSLAHSHGTLPFDPPPTKREVFDGVHRALFPSPCWLPAVLSVVRQGRRPIPIRGMTTSRRNRRSCARRGAGGDMKIAPQQGQTLSCAPTVAKRLRALRSGQYTMAAIAKQFGIRYTTVSRMAGEHEDSDKKQRDLARPGPEA